MLTPSLSRLGVILIAVACALGIVVSLAGEAAAKLSTPDTRAAQLERDQVLKHVGRLHSGILRIDRIEAKLSTWGEFEQQRGRDYEILPFPGALRVWVVAVSGEIRPERTKNDKHYPWGIWVFDGQTLQPIFMAADRAGSWPIYFDRLRDRAVR